MKKISTLFKKDSSDLSRVINEVDPENEWALTEGIPTRKWDGTACAVIGGEMYKRYDAKKGKLPPEGAIPCQEPDPISGHWPHWVKVGHSKKEDIAFVEGWINTLEEFESIPDGTYELVGPKVNGNREKFDKHILIHHGWEPLEIPVVTFDTLLGFLSLADIEGIVFHHPDGRMCKIRKTDFGIKRGEVNIVSL